MIISFFLEMWNLLDIRALISQGHFAHERKTEASLITSTSFTAVACLNEINIGWLERAGSSVKFELSGIILTSSKTYKGSPIQIKFARMLLSTSSMYRIVHRCSRRNTSPLRFKCWNDGTSGPLTVLINQQAIFQRRQCTT